MKNKKELELPPLWLLAVWVLGIVICWFVGFVFLKTIIWVVSGFVDFLPRF